jgi:putative transposase
LRKLLKKQGRAFRVLTTDKAAQLRGRQAGDHAGRAYRQHKDLNNRAENSHQPTRRRERIVKHFKSPRQVQRLLFIHDQVANLFTRRSAKTPPPRFMPPATRHSRPGPR